MDPRIPLLLAALISTMATEPMSVTLETPEDAEVWKPRVGDRIVIDTKDNMGYLIHPNGQHVSFPVITGQNKVVRYIGRSYKATTPERQWMIASRDIKWDRTTFGPSGRFFRLFYEDEQTPYGFHEHRSEEMMFAREDHFQSMGCIIVKSFVLDEIEEMFAVNEGQIEVTTIYGLERMSRKTAT